MTDRWTVLVVETAATGVASAFEAAKAQVLRASSAGEAIRLCVDQPVDLVIVDSDLPGESGLAVLTHLVALDPATHRASTIVRSDDPRARIQAFELGADDAVGSQVPSDELLSRARRSQRSAQAFSNLVTDNARLRELSLTDALTQAANRLAFQERLADEFRRSQRYDDALAVIMIDVDHFKTINDQFGHQAGDQVLRHLTGVLKQAVRETDFVARYGGEEFVVLLPKTQLAGALTVAERICQDVRRIQLATLKQRRITASFGISGYPSRSITNAEQLVKAADEAMYRAKSQGRDQIALHQPALLAGSLRLHGV